jgi:prophage regulatory protein
MMEVLSKTHDPFVANELRPARLTLENELEVFEMSKTMTPTQESARLLAVDDVAAMLGVSARHVYRLADDGRMPRPVKLGGAVRWDRVAISEWIAAGCPTVDGRQGGRR